MKILLVTSRGACGISDHSDQLIAAVQVADPSIQITASALELDGDSFATKSLLYDHPYYDLVVLNYHEALYRNWPVERLLELRHEGYKSVVIYHNTFGEHTPSEMRANGDHRLDFLEAIAWSAVDAVIVHEPCAELDTPYIHYWRQGVPAAQSPRQYAERSLSPSSDCFKGWNDQPLLGTVGFNQPQKNFDRIAQVSHACGWALLICCADATTADITRWTALNPDTTVLTGFQPVSTVVSYLSGCDATIFAHEGAHAGTSGAIRLGLAARKPVIAWHNRQFRDLLADEGYLDWCDGFGDLPHVLANIPIQRVDPRIVQIAERDSWVHLGERYASLFKELTCAK